MKAELGNIHNLKKSETKGQEPGTPGERAPGESRKSLLKGGEGSGRRPVVRAGSVPRVNSESQDVGQ